MHIINDLQLDFCDVLIRPQTTFLNHRGEVDVVRKFKHIDLEACPVMAANMTQMGTMKVAKELVKNQMIGSLHKFYTKEQLADFFEKNGGSNRYFVTIGIREKEKELEKLKALESYEFCILIDVPNAYIPTVKDLVVEVREKFPTRVIAVGNVCTGDRTQELIKAGANIIKIGVGNGITCHTRLKTGCGRPQLSTIIECADAAHQVGGYVIADGGIGLVGDFCKAFVAGADICMSGSMFAGCDEAEGEVIEKTIQTSECIYDESENHEYLGLLKKTEKYKAYYGMSSFRAQRENYGKVTETGTSEGEECKLIPCTGPIVDTINDIKGGLRSCGTYIGAKNIKHFSRQGTFYKVNRIK